MIVAFLALWLIVAVDQAWAVPPCSTYYWRKPIQNGAIRANPLTIGGGFTFAQWYNSYRLSREVVFTSGAGDPVKVVKHRTAPTGNQSYCATGKVYTNDWPSLTIKIPNATLYTANPPGADHRAVFIDGTGVTDYNYFERCSTGEDPASKFTPSKNTASGPIGEPYLSTGDCMPFKGGNGGTQLPVLPALIRLGELTSAVGVEIEHTLKGGGGNGSYSFAGPSYGEGLGTSTPGYRWPAKSADSCRNDVPSCHQGSFANLESGALITLPCADVDNCAATFNCNTQMQTEPAKKICKAIQEYGLQYQEAGGNVQSTDSQRPLVFMVEASIGSSGFTSSLVDELKTSPYSIDLEAGQSKTNCNGITDPETLDFCEDMNVIADNFRVVTNNIEVCPKGCTKPIFASAAQVNATSTTVTLTSPVLNPLLPASGVTGFTLTNNGANCAVSAATTSGLVVTLTHCSSTGQRLVSYAESTGNLTTSADPEGATYELVGFTNGDVSGDGGGSGALVVDSFQYTNGTPVASDELFNEWAGVPFGLASTAEVVSGACANDADCSGKLYSLWDSTNLWLGVDVDDADSCPPSSTLPYQDDNAEFHIDRSRDAGLNSDLDNFQVWFKTATPEWEEGVSTGHAATNARWFTKVGGWRGEMQIPWSTFGIAAPTAGTILGFDMRIDDDDTCDGTLEANLSIAHDATGGNFVGLTTLTLSSSSEDLGGANLSPIISSISADPGQTTATITATTNEAATCIVDYEIAPFELPYDNSTTATASGTSHSKGLTSLTAGSVYTYRWRCNDGADPETTGTDFTFTTTVTPPAACTITQTRYQFYTFSESESDALVYNGAAESASIEVMENGSFSLRAKLAATVSACTERPFTWEYSTTLGGAQTDIGNSCGSTDLAFVDDTVSNHLETLASERLTSDQAGANTGRLYEQQSGQTHTMAQNSDLESVLKLQVCPGVNAGATRYIRAKSIDAYTATPFITVVKPAHRHTGGLRRQ